MAYHPKPYGDEKITDNGTFYAPVRGGQVGRGHLRVYLENLDEGRPFLRFDTKITRCKFSNEDHFAKMPVGDLNLVFHCKSERRLKRVLAKAIVSANIRPRGKVEFAKGFIRMEDVSDIIYAVEYGISLTWLKNFLSARRNET